MESPPEGLHVLVVDDDEDSRDLQRFVLEHWSEGDLLGPCESRSRGHRSRGARRRRQRVRMHDRMPYRANTQEAHHETSRKRQDRTSRRRHRRAAAAR
jgi:hypothetical protein